MLKFKVCMFIVVALPIDACAEILKFVSARDGHIYEAWITSTKHANSVSFYRDDRLLGTYDNLIVNESSLSSSLVPVIIGAGIALKIESDGSRNKYQILAPIEFVGGNLYVECLYKNLYGAVEDTRSVGAICQRQELHQFDVSASINAANLNLYAANQNWLKSLPPGSCSSAVGIEVGSYRIARCTPEGASETSKQKINALDQKNRLLVSTTGYELIPLEGSSEFFLVANMKNDAVLFKGDFSCYAIGSNVSDTDVGTARIGASLGINYAIGKTGKCLKCNYSYASKNREISLRGNVAGEIYYLLEMGADRISSGAFMLNPIRNGIQGVWVGVPPKGPFVVYGR
ncbi:hypothetical protein OKW43_001864 [Paraburkholderia sp. WC7.3g]|uniref:hypothetical protein n=1 Tax=Paraburkholderia sp. WC7.3g TaxID=2991070 RepID=UPI003D1FE6DA